ncbi:MAG TPA: ABC transporter permease [Dehalococcoidia bacterium]|nr:ABC transporter permease [Dehalococcoidia bacterium]
MRGFTGIGPLIMQRLAAGWRLLAVLAFGILIAATLLAISPVYTRVMSDLGLEASLAQQIGSASRNGFVRFGLPLGAPDSAVERQTLASVLADEIGWLSASEVRFGGLPPLTLARPGEPFPTGSALSLPQTRVVTASGLEDHVRVVDGRLARASNDPSRIEGVISTQAAQFFSAKPGDYVEAAYRFDDCNRPPPTMDPVELQARARFPCVPTVAVEKRLSFVISGVVEQLDPDEPYWSAAPAQFPVLSAGDNPPPPLVTVMIPEDSFYKTLPAVGAGLASEFRLTTFADLSRLNSANLPQVRQSLDRLRERITERGAIADLAMQSPLAEYQSRASFNQVPLLLLLLQVVGIAVYYVLLVSSLLAERRAEEIAMLRSRGASVGQVVALAAGEAAILGLGAAVAAPFLASAAVAALGKTGTFESVSGGGLLPFTLVPASFLFALGGAAIAAIAVVIPAFFAARRGMVLFLRSSARPGKPVMQRYYLDLGLAGLAALGLYQLNQRGSVFDPRSVGGWSADPLVLLSPLLLIAAVGAMMFRFLPPLLSLVSRIVSTTAGPGLTLGFWQLTRSPARYTQLALLVVMAAAVGTFAATYGETTDRSQEERALYDAGTDARLTGTGRLDRLQGDAIREALTKIPGVEGVATAYRTQLALGPLPSFGEQIPVLGIDPENAPSLLWFRDDFAAEPLDTLLRRVAGSPAGGAGIPLMGEPRGVALWVNPINGRPGSTLWLRTLDANGVFRLHELGELEYEGYRRLETRFSPERETIRYPLSIVGLIFTQAQSLNDASRNLLMDDLTLLDADGVETVIEDFEGPFRWDVIRTATRNRDITAKVGQGAYRGAGAAQYGFRTGTGASIRGMYFSDPNIPLPAIASKRFLERSGLRPGGEVELVLGNLLVPLSIQGDVDLFPTLGDPAAGFLIVNQEHLFFYAGLTAQTTALAPNEVWLRLPPDKSARAAVFAKIREEYGIPPSQQVDSVKVLEDVQRDPVIRAGGSGVLLLALLAVFSILALGFGLTLYLGGQARTVEVSVMRAVGLSPRQVFTMISLEYLLVAVIGLIIGTIAGLRISDTMLSFLNVTEDGGRVVPPFTLATRWDTVGIAFAATALAFIGGVAGLAFYFLRLPVSRILRLTR